MIGGVQVVYMADTGLSVSNCPSIRTGPNPTASPKMDLDGWDDSGGHLCSHLDIACVRFWTCQKHKVVQKQT